MPVRARGIAVRRIARLLAFALTLSAPTSPGATEKLNPEQRTAHHFDSIRQQPGLLLAFLREMPKGGDLHIHLAGAIYAESLIDFAAAGRLLRRPHHFRSDRASLRRCLRPLRQQASRSAAPTRTTFSTTPSSMPGPCATGPAKNPATTTFLPPSTNFFRP